MAGEGGFAATHKLHKSWIKKDTPHGMCRAHGQGKTHALDLYCEGGDGWHVTVTNIQGAWKEQLSQKRQRELYELFWKTNALRKAKNIRGNGGDVERINQTFSTLGTLEVGPGNYVHISPRRSLDFPLCFSLKIVSQNHCNLGRG